MDQSLVLGGVIVGAAIAGGALISLRISKQKRKSDVNIHTIRDV